MLRPLCKIGSPVGLCPRVFLLSFLSLLPVFASAQVYINEVMYDVSGTDTGREWIEVYNAGASGIDFSLWKLFEANTNHSLVAVSGGLTVPALGYAIIADDSAKFLSDYPSFSGILFSSSFSLNNSGEALSLKDNTQTVIDTLTYDPSIGANGDGNSLQKSGSNWLTATPTPGQANSLTSNSATSTATASSTTSTTTTSSSSSGSDTGPTQSSSAHYGSSSLSTKKPDIDIGLSAGRDRLGSVGSPLEFRAETALTIQRNSSFKWNFGDGTESHGDTVVHTYEYPGEYVVVLNAILAGSKSVSRINVKIIEPSLSIVSADPERVEIRNNSSQEVSLFGRALVSGEQSFLFPQDTVLKAFQNISFSSRVTNLHPTNTNGVYLLNIGGVESAKMGQAIEEKKRERVASLSRELSLLQQQLAMAYSSEPRVGSVAQVLDPESVSEKKEVKSSSQVAKVSDSPGTNRVGDWLALLKRFFLGR